MDNDRSARLYDLFQQALRVPEADRASWLSDQNDPRDLLAEVGVLLAHAGEGPNSGLSDVVGAFRRELTPSVAESPQVGFGEHPGDSIGVYKLQQKIGEGGFGVVWLAERRSPMVQRVALKVIKPGMDSKAVVARFDQERQALAVMDHPNVARVFDGGVTPNGRPYFVMEHVPGEPITEYCDRHRLTTRQRLELFLLVCDAVQHAHTKGIIHRDLKPSNVLVIPGDPAHPAPIPKVIDFGVAKAISHTLTDETIFTEQGQIIGTPEFMSPEQAEMSPTGVDTRSDVYSLGVLLYQLLSGVLPFDPKTLRSAGYGEIRRIIREVEPPRPSTRLTTLGDAATAIAARHRTDSRTMAKELRRELEWVPLKAMRKNRNERYGTPTELARDIRNYLSGQPLEAGPESAAYRLRKFARRNRGPLLAVAAVVLALVVGLAGTLLMARAAELERAAAARSHQRSETILAFVVGALQSGDPVAGGRVDTTVAEAMRNAARNLAATQVEHDPETSTKLMITIAEILLHNGHVEEAKPLLARVLDARRSQHTGDHPSVAEAMNDLGVALLALGRSAEAKPLLQDARSMYRRCFPDDHLSVALSMSNVGTLLTQLGHADEAVSLLQESLDIYHRLLGENHVRAVGGLNDLGDAYRQSGNPGRAEELFRKAVDASRRLDESNGPLLAQSLNNLATVLSDKGMRSEAETLFEEALKIYQSTYPGDHPRTAQCLGNLATLRAYLGRPSDAESMLRDALAMQRRLHRADHPDVAQGLNNLGFALRLLKRDSEALPLFEESLVMRRRLFEGNHHLIAVSMSNLATVYHAVGRGADAERLLVEAVGMDRGLFPGGHPETAHFLHMLGMLRYEAGRFAEAEAAALEAVAMFERAYPQGHPRTASAMCTLAQSLYRQGRRDGAREIIRKAAPMAIRTEVPPGSAVSQVREVQHLIGAE